MTCPICQNPKIIDLPKIPIYYFCLRCKTARRKKFNKVNYSQNYYSGKSNLAAKLIRPLFKFFYLIRRSYVGLDEKGLWIDVGAGDGDFLKTVNAKRKIGVEVSSSSQKKMQSLDLEVMLDKQFLKLKRADADVISFWHVLEHLEKPQDYLKAARENLSRNGKLIIAVPNIDSLEFSIFGKFWFHLEPQFHQWQFSINSMRLLLKSQNFKVDLIDYISPEHQFAGLLQSFINTTSGTQNVLHILVKRKLGDQKIPTKGIVWSLFWLTFGLSVILSFWLTEIIIKRPGTFVMVASKK